MYIVHGIPSVYQNDGNEKSAFLLNSKIHHFEYTILYYTMYYILYEKVL